MSSPRRRRLAPLALLAPLTLLPLGGCGWYYLDPDPNLVAVGAPPPAFELPNRFSEPVSLGALADDHNALLVFYRGHW